ncbi:MAG: hypothetical protein PUJ70_05150 [Treponema sp.]|nr:hypothetical protein [Treponema sp.]MDY5838774.1 hypothetical protein [Treponema sp.]
MKRIISIVVILFTLTSLFAQNAKYKELLEKARSYESKNEWAYALGYYADAITADPVNAVEAAEKFKSISDSIKSGNPGLTPVTGRLQMEAWESLLCNTEKYFTENFPYFVNFSKPQMKKKNGKNYDYWSNVEYSFNFKFNSIVLPILKGYKKVYKESWGLPDVRVDDDAQYIINFDRCITERWGSDWWDIKHSSWPITSVTKIKNPEMVKDGYGNYVQVDKNDSSYYYNKVATYSGAYFGFYNSFAVDKNKKTLYELTLVIADNKGKALCSPVKYMLDSDTVTFENIPENIADMIDNETARIKVTGIALKYGYVKDNEPVESLPSVSVNSSNAEIYDSVDTMKNVKLFRSGYGSKRVGEFYLYDYFNGTVRHVDSFSVACYKYWLEKDIRKKYDEILSSVENNTLSKVDSSYEEELEMSDEYVANRFSAYEGVTPCYDEFCNPIDGNGYRKTEDGSRRYERKLSPVELEEYKKQLKSFYEPEMRKYERLIALKNNYRLGMEDSTRVSKLIESFTNLKTAVEKDDFKKINDLVPQLKKILSEEDLLKLETICAERDAEREKKGILVAITARKSQMLDKISEYHNKKFNMSTNKVNEYSIISMAIEESRKSVEELAAAATADASLEVLREVKDKFETITTENLDLLLAEIEKGKELISKMGIKLTFYSSYSYRAISIYSLEVEKNSIAKKAKVKGKRLIFDEEFNPDKMSRYTYGDGYITDCSFADFCIRIARSSGKEFALYTSKKDEPFIVKVP